MFISESLCYFGYFYSRFSKKGKPEYFRRQAEAEEQGKIIHSNKKYFWLIFPMLLDFTTSTLSYFALTVVNASIDMMFNGTTPIFTAFFALCIMKQKLYGYNWVAVIFVIIGMVLVGLSTFLFLDSDTSYDEIYILVVAYIMLVVSVGVSALFYIVEEWVVGKFFLIPF